MNHLEQLVAEWLQYKGYFVRVSVQVGPREKGGYEGELDVVGFHPARKHFLHVECSLDANKWEVRKDKFAKKFERGHKFARNVFAGLELPEVLDRVAVFQFAGTNVREIGGGRVITVRELVREILAGLKGTSPASNAVPSNLPLLRTLQLAADAGVHSVGEHRLIPAPQ